MGRRVLAAGVVSSALALAAACEVAFPTHLEGTPLSEAGAPDAAEASAPDAAPDSGCVHAFPPPPPASDPNPNVRTTFTAAVKEIVIGTQTDAGAPLGFDLDGVCTCPGPPSCVSTQRQCDAPGGRDGAGDALLGLIDAFFAATTEGTLNERVQKGRTGFLIWVADYNGEKDDPNVYASVLLSSGILDDPDAGSHIKPKWDGNDLWNIDPELVAGYTLDADGGYHYTPLAISTVGYVADGVLVAKIPSVTVSYEVARFAIAEVLFTAAISTTPYGYRLDGQLGGRIPTRDVLGVAATMTDPSNPKEFLCGDNKTYQSFRSTVCSTADLAADPARDNTGQPCEALSLTLGLTAFSAKTGSPFANQISPPGCDGSVDLCPPP